MFASQFSAADAARAPRRNSGRGDSFRWRNAGKKCTRKSRWKRRRRRREDLRIARIPRASPAPSSCPPFPFRV